MLEFCRWLQETRLSSAIAESTWGFPLFGAIHVLIAGLFGGAVLFDVPPRFRRTGAILAIVSGLLVFLAEPVRFYESAWARVKIAVLVAIGLQALRPRALPRWIVIALWAAVIFASRGIAYF